ncbi:MAG: glutaredoxin family protein [Microbacteriaceae bacterium]|mgnify:FL=1|jgi:glutaredoxin|nr:glutaredoxin family protein [Microbacteriaceae bacterium]
MVVPDVRLTLLSKPGCHLCDAARDAVTEVIAQLGAAASAVTVEELSILDDPELNERYWDEIPVVLVNGRVHTIWRVDPARLTRVLEEAIQ